MTEQVEVKPVEETQIVASPTPMMMLQMATQQRADPAVIEKYMDLCDRHEKNEARKAYTVAMAQFRADCPTIDRNRSVSFGQGKTSYTHADLAGTVQQIKAILSECGLSHSWRTQQIEGQISVTCVVTHILGHSESTTMTAPSDASGSKNAIQAIGSTVTYLERYTLFAMLGLASADGDDDGNAAGDDSSITDDDAVKLALKLDGIGADLTGFLANFKVARLEDIPASQLERAKDMIAARKAQKAKEAQCPT